MASGTFGVDDTTARLLVTPLVGVGVPNLAGMIDHGAHSSAGLLLSYAWFIAVALLTWDGNLRLYLRFQDRTAWLTQPWHRVRLLVGVILLFTVPFTGLALWGWAMVTGDPNATGRSIAMAVITIVAAVTFITHVYETLFLVREWGSDRQRGERLQRLNLEAELVARAARSIPTRSSTTSMRSATSSISDTRARRRLWPPSPPATATCCEAAPSAWCRLRTSSSCSISSSRWLPSATRTGSPSWCTSMHTPRGDG